MIKDELQSLIQQALFDLGIREIVTLDNPNQDNFGDYATSIALKLSKQQKENPIIFAEKIIRTLPKNNLIKKIQVIKPGFINIWIHEDILVSYALKLSRNIFDTPYFHFGPRKKVMVEYAHPNTLKLFHIGHMRNISIGESIARILEAVGNKVIRANYQGDVGLHIAKTLWKMKQYINEMGKDYINSLTIQQKIQLFGKAYAQGEKAYNEDNHAKEDILNINKMIYEEHKDIMDLWNETRTWSLSYFDAIYKRMYTRHDKLYFESECHKRGVQICHDLLKKGILTKSKGAVVFDGSKYKVDTRVFLNSLGFPTYEGKELALAEKEFSDFGELDKNIHVVTPEQTSFFKTTFKVEELIDEKKYKNKQYHLAYNWVKLKTGKMSSRTGNVIEGEWLIDEAKNILKKNYHLDEETAETLAVASVKYSFLKISPQLEIHFDFKESVSLEGNSAPYLIYTYVRTKSILAKTPSFDHTLLNYSLNPDERNLAKHLFFFSSSVYEAASKLSPNIIASYLFELAQHFNLFYQKNPILKSENETKNMRLLLVAATGNTLQKGLMLLGIKTVDKM